MKDLYNSSHFLRKPFEELRRAQDECQQIHIWILALLLTHFINKNRTGFVSCHLRWNQLFVSSYLSELLWCSENITWYSLQIAKGFAQAGFYLLMVKVWGLRLGDYKQLADGGNEKNKEGVKMKKIFELPLCIRHLKIFHTCNMSILGNEMISNPSLPNQS